MPRKRRDLGPKRRKVRLRKKKKVKKLKDRKLKRPVPEWAKDLAIRNWSMRDTCVPEEYLRIKNPINYENIYFKIFY